MMILKRSALVLSLLLAACVHAPQHTAVVPPVQQKEAQQAEAPETEPPLVLPRMELTGDMLYEFLLAEVASQRANPDLAAEIYQDLAVRTQDPRVVRRAAQLALEAHQGEQSLDALRLWLKLEPASQQAKQLLTMLLVNQGKLEDARPYLEEMLAAAPDKAGHTFLQIYSLLVRNPDKEATFNLLDSLAQKYPQVAEGQLVLAQAALAAGKHDQALAATHKARTLHPDWEGTVQLEAQLLRRDSPQQALAVLKQYLGEHKDSFEVRLLYARMLLQESQYQPAREEFQRLLAQHPESAELAFAVAMLSLQMGELDKAESGLRKALAEGKKDKGTVYYYLGQLNEAKKDDESALKYYRLVPEGELAFEASLRIAYLLNKSGKLEEARDNLHHTLAQSNQQRVQLLLVEAQLLNDAKKTEEAYQVLIKGLETLPNHPDLLFEAGMLADRMGKHDVFERMMRKVIEVKPDSAQAYNALGYSLLDRNERLEEGMQLVEKASQLDPDDAAIIDSVGWGHYRLGNLKEGVKFLRRAYSANPDPEIAAHLGEVLWMQGIKDQAKKIWGEALKAHPDNAVLQGTMKRLDP